MSYSIGRIIKAVFRRLKINRALAVFVPHKYLVIDKESVLEAKRFLNEFSKDPETSCVSLNQIEPQVDLHIIIPAYNVEKYICQCLDSIVKPNKKISYTVTVVNDGSTDGTGELLQKYADVEQVEIITQENKGFSGARNTGLKKIKGRYICFVDSDDWIEWSVLEKMVIEADGRKADMIEAGFYIVDEDGTVDREVKSDANRFKGFPWGKVYRSEYFERVVFPEGYWYEDSIIEQILFETMPNKFAFPESVYYYRQRSGSITKTSARKNKSIDSMWILLALHKDRETLGIEKTQVYYEYVLRHIRLSFSRIAYQSKEVKEKCFVIFSDFLNAEFSDFSTESGDMKKLEGYLRNRDFGKFLISL